MFKTFSPDWRGKHSQDGRWVGCLVLSRQSQITGFGERLWALGKGAGWRILLGFLSVGCHIS